MPAEVTAYHHAAPNWDSCRIRGPGPAEADEVCAAEHTIMKDKAAELIAAPKK
jgi:hypothetical protein